ncbi:MAG: decaprenyl-phosphate phosphoribosyltransferase [Planctomycetes bacterium]|nr:decaprenyl-phosphate phosphoribosyltransferase [Planctomycetota bacterium]
MLSSIIKLARVDHWIKNVVVLIPVILSKQIFGENALVYGGYALAAAVAFCFASSFAYAINDIKDADADRKHPRKKNRPVASGSISKPAALAIAACFIVLAFGISIAVSYILTFIIALYLVLQVTYSIFLKQKPLIDVICIALGFVLRAAAGAVAIEVNLSPWLFICMFTICLFMGFCKRYNEMVTLGDTDTAEDHRHTLLLYTPDLLTHLITLSAGIAVVVFLFYGLNPATVARIGTNYLIYTLPLVVYAVFRFAMLSMRGAYTDPTDLILHDRPFQITVGLWALMTGGIILYGKDLTDWLDKLY